MSKETVIAPRFDRFVFRERHFFVKRDDLVDPLLSGNKYWKLYSLIRTAAEKYKSILSYGGTQSNAMLSIAALCHKKGWQFYYTSKAVAAHIKASPVGNLKLALELGMQLHEVSPESYEEAVNSLKCRGDDSVLYLPQGGADPLAQAGMDRLAEEVRQWQQAHGLEKLHLVLPSGTGTTAFYLASALPSVAVLTTAVVGDKDYLISQMQALGPVPQNLHVLENIKKYHFAKPYAEFLAIYRELQHAGIEFDLIYGAHMWHTLLQHIDAIDGDILYLHTGGVIGNKTMLDRYHHKGLIDPTESSHEQEV